MGNLKVDLGLSPQEEEMFLGYLDGLKADEPEPNENRSASYRHGFANGRDDLRKKPRASAQELREAADAAMKEDAERVPF